MKTSILVVAFGIAVISTSCIKRDIPDPGPKYQLNGFWKVYYKAWDNPELNTIHGAVKIEQNYNEIRIISHDTILTRGTIIQDKIQLESFFLEEGIEEISIYANDTLLTGSPLVEAIDYFKLIKIDLGGNWKVIDNWFDGSKYDLGLWEIKQSAIAIVILNNNDTITGGHINYNTVAIEDISGYGIKNIFITHNDTLQSETPLMESSNGLTFIRMN
jgi:hypothetical protein